MLLIQVELLADLHHRRNVAEREYNTVIEFNGNRFVPVVEAFAHVMPLTFDGLSGVDDLDKIVEQARLLVSGMNI